MYSGKRLLKRAIVIIRDMLATIGILFMISEVADAIFDYQGIYSFYQKYSGWILLVLFVLCAIKNRDKLTYTVSINDSPDVTITLKVCDALKNKGAVIIPTNSTFDTVMKEEFISKGSLQGQYQIKYFEGDFNSLDRALEIALSDKPFTELKEKRKYKKNRYPIGTVGMVYRKKKRAYFLADSDINRKGNPIDVDAEDISKALVGLWDTLTEEGYAEPLSLPLLGTGKARAKDVSRNDVVKQIIVSFIAATKEHKITESLTICIHPSDFDKVDWDKLCEFLRFQCMFANLNKLEPKAIGTAEAYSNNSFLDQSELDNMIDKTRFQGTNQDVLSEREQLVVSLLAGNKMTEKEVAVALGSSIEYANSILSDLVRREVVQYEKNADSASYYYLKQTEMK